MKAMSLVSYVALGFSVAALAAAAAMLRRIACIERRIEEAAGLITSIQRNMNEFKRDYEELSARLRVLEKAVAKALESYEAEDMLEKLRRRRRRRYIVFRIVTEDGTSPPPEEVEKAILRAVERLGGQLTAALARVQLVYYHPEQAAGIIRASHDTKYLVLAALGLVRSIGGRRALIIPVRTTGTIRSAKKALGLRMRELKKA